MSSFFKPRPQRHSSPTKTDPAEYKIKFGRYKGSPLKDIPIGYFDWLLGENCLLGENWLCPEVRSKIFAYLKTQAEWHDDFTEGDD